MGDLIIDGTHRCHTIWIPVSSFKWFRRWGSRLEKGYQDISRWLQLDQANQVFSHLIILVVPDFSTKWNFSEPTFGFTRTHSLWLALIGGWMHHAFSGFGGFQRSQDGSCMILVVIRLMVGDVSSSRDIRYHFCRCFSLYKDRNYNTSVESYEEDPKFFIFLFFFLFCSDFFGFQFD